MQQDKKQAMSYQDHKQNYVTIRKQNHVQNVKQKLIIRGNH